MTVDFFSAEVKYSGKFEDYTKQELFDKAMVRVAQGLDAYESTQELEAATAKKLDGMVVIDDTYPCNKIATVRWAYIRQEEEK